MNDSISFDRAADYYDETRGFPPVVGNRIARALAEWIDPSASLLEIGTGTGRIALPLIKSGYHVTGLDLSSRMLSRFRQKALPGHPALVLGDAHTLPFPEAHFHAVITVHFFHLVANWKGVVAEIRRVLNDHGYLLIGYGIGNEETPDYQLRQRLDMELTNRGYKRGPGFVEKYDEIHEELLKSGAQYLEITAAEWQPIKSISETMESMKQQIWSRSWSVPEDEYRLALDATFAWGHETFPEPDLLYADPHKFAWQRYQW